MIAPTPLDDPQSPRPPASGKPNEPTSFPRALHAARLAAGYPVADHAAKRLGMHGSNFWKLENSAKDPHWSMIWRLIVGLGLGLEFFFPHAMILAASRRIRLARKARGQARGPAAAGDDAARGD